MLREHAEPEAEPDHSVAASLAATTGTEPRDRRADADRARPDQHLPAADHAADFDLSTPPRVLPTTCTTSASTGSTSRRCWPPSRGSDARLRRRRPPTASTRPAAAPRAWPRCRPRRARLGHGRARRHRAQPRRASATPAENRVVVGRAAPRPRTRRTPTPSTSTGQPAAAGCASRCSATTTCADGVDDLERRRRRAALPRPPLPARARHRRRRRPPARCTTGSTTSWSAGGAADAELNYRRFFAVNTLAGVRVEDPEVFDATHAEIARWFDEGLVDGLRVDHPDGLRDPAGYLDDLAAAHRRRLRAGREDPRAAARSCRPSWADRGTTGYDALARHRPGARRPGRRGGRSTRSTTRLRGGATSTGPS